MNIYYTKEFTEDLGKQIKILRISKYGLSRGKNISGTLTSISRFDIKTSPKDRYYEAQAVEYGENGIQLSIDVPENDSSFYYAEDNIGKNESYYQAIIFYYSDLIFSPDDLKPAFVLYENFNYDEETKKGDFSGLNLTALKNIITIKELPGKKCKIDMKQSDLTEFLESKTLYVETTRTGSKSSYPSREYVEKKLDIEYNDDPYPYFGTVRINKYGIKLY